MLKIKKNILLDMVSLANRMIAKHPLQPVLSHIKVDIADNKLTVTGTDLSSYYSQTVVVNHDVFEPLSFAVPASKFCDLIKACDEDIDITLKKDKVVIKSGQVKFGIKWLPTDDYPDSTVQNDDVKLSITAKKLIKNINNVFYATDKKAFSSVLNGVYIDDNTFIATDSYRVACLLPETVHTNGANIPTKSIIDILAIAERLPAETLLEIGWDCETVSITALDGNMVYSSTLIAGVYPRVRGLIPDYSGDKGGAVEFARLDCIKALDSIKVLANTVSKLVKCTLVNGYMSLESQTADLGEAEITIEAAYDPLHEGAMFGLNGDYFKDMLSHVAGDTVKLQFGIRDNKINPTAPLIAISDNVTHLLMPIQVRTI